METRTEVFVSVDVETSGPIPGEYSMLSIGACLVEAPESNFECRLKPLNRNADPEALAVTNFSLLELEQTGKAPRQAMAEFDAWINEVICADHQIPVFVGLNAPFDWSFVNYYFHRFHGKNPFGFSALDIKAYFMGVTGCSWRDTRSSMMQNRLLPKKRGNHDALQDAIYQAELFALTRRLKPAQ
ncbi:3'-5' exonuclease [Achromobacter sp. GbtcB20]|uniref:3'-5' exonuclease n=1 Tax=Achromobacter sp. GbtcB20 TaxID=2824765 RepID=UPI00126693CC|nr:3'-5' exonuclease [Achromobacter sp. GbtcB20]